MSDASGLREQIEQLANTYTEKARELTGMSDRAQSCDWHATATACRNQGLWYAGIAQQLEGILAARPPETAPAPAYRNVWIVRQGDGLRGVHEERAGAEEEIAGICREHPDLKRSDFTIQVERIRPLSASRAGEPATGAGEGELTAIHEASEVCACGCRAADHENYGEDGESCEDESHNCYRTSRSALAELTALRNRVAALSSPAPPEKDPT